MIRAGQRIGIDANLPLIVDGPRKGDLAPQVARPEIIGDTGAGWVRLNFVFRPWTRPFDTTLHQGRTWEEASREIIVGLRGKDLNIYGLISNEAVAMALDDRFRSPPTGQPTDEWLDNYLSNFVAILRMFCGDVQIFESFNEPDDWHGANQAIRSTLMAGSTSRGIPTNGPAPGRFACLSVQGYNGKNISFTSITLILIKPICVCNQALALEEICHVHSHL